MTTFSKTCIYLMLSLAAGCSAVKPAPAPVECPTVEAPSCPACPSVPQCRETPVIEKIVTVPAPAPTPTRAATAGEMNLPIVGAVEWARVEPGDIRMPARIDTGSASTSLQARDIELIEKDGKRWVDFTVLDPATDQEVKIEQRLRRKRVVKLGDGEELHRYVVRLWITLGKTRSLVDVYLTDRDKMEFPLLIGRNMLMDNVIVDVSRKQKVTR